MTRCPNCGSAIRIGAKFCTSCGFRLTVDEPATASSIAPSRSPFSTTSTPAWSAEPPETVAPVEAAEADAEEEDVEPAWAKAADVEDAEIGMDGDAAGSDTTDDAAATDDRLVGSGTEPVGHEQEPQPSWFSPAAQDTSGPVSDDMVAALGGDDVDQPESDIASDTDGGDPMAASPAPAPEALRSTYTWNADDQQITAVRDTSTAEAPGGSGSGPTAAPIDGDPLVEARSLVLRLSDLLAAVQSGGKGGATASAATSIADEADVEALRSIVTSAQDRPRDVDVMLDLVLRADTIAAVLTDRDLLLAALRGDEAAVEESWAPEEDEPSTYPAWRSLP